MAGEHEFSLTITSKAQLHSVYMPFIRHGGIFLPTRRTPAYGSHIQLYMRLIDDTNLTQKFSIKGRIVWFTPERALGSRTLGIGIQLAKSEQRVRYAIEQYLGNSDADPTRPRLTF